jgi:hypothetical protein
MGGVLTADRLLLGKTMPRPITIVHITPDFEKAVSGYPSTFKISRSAKTSGFARTPLIHASELTTERRPISLPTEVIYYDYGNHEIYR